MKGKARYVSKEKMLKYNNNDININADYKQHMFISDHIRN